MNLRSRLTIPWLFTLLLATVTGSRPLCGQQGKPYVFTRVAGLTADPGYLEGNASDAKFSSPYGVAVDPQGNAYVADFGNHVIRKVTPQGVTSLYAGSPGVPGASDGVGSGAQFNFPAGVACDGAGVLYVADTGNHSVRVILTNRLVITLASGFNYPNALTVRKDGTVYVSDTYHHVIRKVDPAGAVTVVAGVFGQYGSADGPLGQNRLNLPIGITSERTPLGADGDRLYIADYQNHRIRTLNLATGELSTLAGNTEGVQDGDWSVNGFKYPVGIAAGEGVVYVSDYEGHTIREVQTGGSRYARTIGGVAGSPGTATGSWLDVKFNQPAGLALSVDGALWVAEKSNHRVVRAIQRAQPGEHAWMNMAGNPRYPGTVNGTGTEARFNAPHALAVDSQGNTYVADAGNYTIRKVERNGVVTTWAGQPGSSASVDGTGTDARFSSPVYAAATADGTLYVAESNGIIRKITTGRVVSTIPGPGGSPGIAGLAVGPGQTLYVANEATHTVSRISQTGVVTLLAGQSGVSGFKNDTGAVARFKNPGGLVVDDRGNCYVCDRLNYLIRKITPGGQVSTVAGLPGSVGRSDGMAENARFEILRALALGPDRFLYAADSGRVRRISATGAVLTIGGNSGGISGYTGGPGEYAYFYQLGGIAVDPTGAVYVSDFSLHRVSMGFAAGSGLRFMPGGQAEIFFGAEPWRGYSLERSVTPGAANWTLLSQGFAAPNGSLFFNDIAPPAGKAFYRLSDR